jgi:hypothetical protein
MATAAIHVCIAFSALGNLIGVFFTNGRGKGFSDHLTATQTLTFL